MVMTKKQALDCACHALYPFVNPPLLEENEDGELVPIADAADWEIAEVLRELHRQDEEFGGHAIDTIMTRTFQRAADYGFGTRINKGDLVEGRFETVGKYASRIRRSSFELEG